MDLSTGTNKQVTHQFHDDSIYGFELVQPVPELDQWDSEIILDIDHILEWRKTDDQFKFLISKAELRFIDVSDLQVSFGFPNSTITTLPIDRIDRENEPNLEREPNDVQYRWKIRLHDRNNGFFSFLSTGYQLNLIGDPVLCDDQFIPAEIRTNL